MYGDTFRRWLSFALALALLLAPGSALRAATVTGTIYAADGDLFTGTMLFRTLRTPLVSGSTLVTGGDYRVSVTNGALSTTLLAGDYRVFVGADTKGFIIAVPSGSSSYAILGLITNAITYTEQAYPWESTPPATASISGTVKTDVDAGDPVVYLKSSLDALLATNSAPSKLDITNGTAVNLTGSITNATYDGAYLRDVKVSFVENLQTLLSEASPSVAKLAYVLNDDSNGDATKGTYRYDPTLTGAETATVFMAQDKGGNTASTGRWVRMSAGDNYQMSVDTLDDALAVAPAYLAAGLNPTNSIKLTVKTRARKTLGKKGGATYYYSASAPGVTNLGTTVAYGSGYIQWDGVGDLTLEMFGATPDDETDDTEAIQSAVAYAESLGSGYKVRAAGGTYLVSEPIVLTKCEFSGVRTHQSRVLTAGNTVFQTTNWNTTLYREVFDVNPTGANDGAPWLHDVQVQSSRTNTIAKIPITAVSSRRVFSISTNTTPTFQTGNQTNFYPYLGWAFFYSPAGNYMGGGTVSTAVVSGTNWNITITDGDDFYATPSGTSGLLTTACYVNFSPLTTAGGADRSDPTQVGVVGVRMRGTMSAKVENVGTYETWVGFAFSPATSTSFHWMRDLASWRTSFAAYASAVRNYQGAYDYSGEGVLFASGFAPSLDITVDNEGYSAGMFGFYNLPIASGFNQLWSDGFVVGMQSDLPSGIAVDRAKLDNCFRHGLVTIDGYFDTGYSIGLSFGALDIRGLISTTDTIDSPNGRAIWMRGKTYPAEIWADTLTVMTAPYQRFDYAIDVTNTVANSLTVGRMMTGSGFTNWIPATSRLPALLSSAYGSTNSAVGWSYNNAVQKNLGAEISLANNGTNRLTVNSSGVTGYSANGSKVTFHAGDTTFTAYGDTNIYNKTGNNGVYIGARSAGDAAEYSGAHLLEYGSSGNVATQVRAANGTAIFDGLSSGGTYSSPTAMIGDTGIASHGSRAYDGSSYNTTARLLFLTKGTQSSTNRGSYGRIEVTRLNTTSRTTYFTFNDDGSLAVPGSIELGHASDTTLARSAAGVVALESVPVIDAAVGTLTYSGTTVNITAGKGVAQEDVLTCTNSFSLTFSSLNNKDAGCVTIWPAATNCTVTLPSYGFSPSGSTLTVNSGTGNTNYTVLTWFNTVVGGTNRVSINAANYYR